MPAPRKLPVFWLGLGGVAVLAVIVIIVSVSGGGSKKKNTSVVDANGTALQQTQPVQVTGQPLPNMPDSGTDKAVGTVIPTVAGKSFDGTPVTLANDGKGKVVIFMAHWCPHCQAEIPKVADWLSNHSLPANVEVYGVATSTNPSYPNYPPSSWLQKIGWTQPTMADDTKGTAGTAFGLTAFPYFVVVDPSGKVVSRTSGELDISKFPGLVQQASGA